MTDLINVRRDGAVMRIGFNRPDKKNAIFGAMYSKIADSIEEADTDSNIRAVLFDSTGDMFTAGNDIGEFMAGISGMADPHDTPPVMRFLTTIATAQSPLIAAVQGPAVGVGVTMLLHCDLVYAAPHATFHTPFVDLALVPEAASTLILPRIAGHQRAAEMLVAGKKIDAARAREFGFVNEVVAPEALEETAMNAAQDLAAKAPRSVRLAKQLLKGDPDETLARMKQESAHFAEQLGSDEFREAGAAFLEKRKPDFSKLG